MSLYERWCDATREKDKRKHYWTYVEKEDGRDEEQYQSLRGQGERDEALHHGVTASPTREFLR